MKSLTREAVEEAAAGAADKDLGRHLLLALGEVQLGLGKAEEVPGEVREGARNLVAQLGDDLRMLRESWSGRMPTAPPSEGRPRQSRPDAGLELLGRQLEALAEGTRILLEESPRQGSASIPDPDLGSLTQGQHLAAMLLRVRAFAGSLP
ncbi:MAG: hypothetical protein WEB00_07025 [Dehalococcoidia bacterium]